MKLILLVQPEMLPIPVELEQLQHFGSETIQTAEGDFIEGDSYYLTGPRQVFFKWLRQFRGVWVSNNPIMGEWKVVHIKPKYTLRFSHNQVASYCESYVAKLRSKFCK